MHCQVIAVRTRLAEFCTRPSVRPYAAGTVCEQVVNDPEGFYKSYDASISEMEVNHQVGPSHESWPTRPSAKLPRWESVMGMSQVPNRVGFSQLGSVHCLIRSFAGGP
jgi:hypothetical protein